MARKATARPARSKTVRSSRPKVGEPSGVHLAAIKQLQSGPVVSASIRRWLTEILQNWAIRGAPWLSDPNKKSWLDKDVAKAIHGSMRNIPRAEAAEYLLALSASLGPGTFESAVATALEWAKKRHPEARISRTTIIKEYGCLTRMKKPARSIEHFLGKETLEQTAAYDQAYLAFKEAIEAQSDEDLAAQAAEDQARRLKDYAFRIGKKFGGSVSSAATRHAAKNIVATDRASLNFSDQLLHELSDEFIEGALQGLLSSLRITFSTALHEAVNKIPVSKSDCNT
jgi:hypothetical protein